MRTVAVCCAAALLLTDPMPVGAESYQYDAAGRLTTVTYDSGKKLSYTYDAGGNVVLKSIETAFAGDAVPASSLAEVWVDFSHAGTELGTETNPFDTADEGVIAVTANGVVHLESGVSGETLTIVKPMTLHAANGIVRIGLGG
jgi:YD repeat-containing protein